MAIEALAYIIQDKPVIKTLRDYIIQQATTNPALKPIASVVESTNGHEIGIILTERLINIPAEVSPPMYRMLLEEIAWAVEEKEPYKFSHYLILSKTYQEVTSQLSLGDDRPQKKKKRKEDSAEVFYFHPEDEVLHRHAIAHGNFAYVKQEAEGQADAKRAFQELGIKPQGHMILLEASQGEAAVKALEDFLRPS